jgi:hypothetical protein
MLERRTVALRKRTLKAGAIEFDRGGGITSTVRNLSDTGALLQVENVIGVPDEFTLFIDADHFKRRCQVVWRQLNKLGVRFV